MRAVVYTATGGPDVLRLVQRDAAEPRDGQVRVRIHLAGVNPTDWKNRRATPMPFPEVVPGQDGAGIVDAVGPGVHGVAVGQRVWVLLAAWQRPTGTAQELVVLPAERVVPLPDEASFEVGASLGVPAVTAHRCLTVAERGPARLAPGALAGRTVLVAGGAGAVGHAAIQLARWAGATVLSTVSSSTKAALARAAGAHHVIDYTAGDTAAAVRAQAPGGVDLVVEVAPGPNAELDAAVLATGGVVAVYANDGADNVTLPVRPMMVLNARFQFVLLYTVPRSALAAAVDSVREAAAAGRLEVGAEHGLPLHRFALAEAAAAHAAVEGGAVGKVLIDVRD